MLRVINMSTILALLLARLVVWQPAFWEILVHTWTIMLLLLSNKEEALELRREDMDIRPHSRISHSCQRLQLCMDT